MKYHQLTPKKDLSVTNKISLHDNLIVHGDNLKALKALLPTYSGRVKCIYIDPPYNTGNESWVYNDNVNSPMIKEWLGKIVDKEDLTRHDKWLCMMMPRLKLLRELLKEDGVIYISIDDNEAHHCKLLMDEIFGESNFIADVTIVNNLKGRNDRKYIATANERLLMYVKSFEFEDNGFELPSSRLSDFQLKDDIGPYRLLGLRKRGGADTREKRPKMFYPIFVNPNTGEVSLEKKKPFTVEVLPRKSDGTDGAWRWGKDTAKKRIADLVGQKVNGKEKFDVSEKDYLHTDGELRRIKPKSVIAGKDYSTDLATKDLSVLLPNCNFNNPKPLQYIIDLIEYSTDKDSIILDSFSGSGTTGHAVSQLNKTDGGNRKYIMIEMEDYANKVTAERMRKVIKGVPKSKFEKGTGGTFSYFELGPEIEMESILKGKNLPSFKEFARYLFYTATGDEFDEKLINDKTGFIGESKNYQVYLQYKPDIEWLKKNALTLEGVKSMPKFKSKQRLVFAPAKYVDDHTLMENRIDFCQLPYEIYRIQK